MSIYLCDIFKVILGLCMILKGADVMVESSSALARKFAISEAVIGLTVVAFGTSLPEFVVSFFSALRGSGDMSVGNIMGSNIFNALCILGASALFVVIPVGRRALKIDIPLSLLVAVLCCLLCFDVVLWNKEENMISRWDALILMFFFGLFLCYTFRLAYRKDTGAIVKESTPVFLILLKIAFGIALLVFGGNILIGSASNIALNLGISEAVIGLTILAGGTSAPEFATSIVAARKGQIEMAIGNVIGSNVFNVLFVLGSTALIRPIYVTEMRPLDVVLFVGGPLLLWVFALCFRRITRWMGIVMIAVYVAYLAMLVREVTSA
ncbi:MAG: calcium/sodium antiporter [Bacteroidaceae bacterium]|nr:calcium/sodium antiporter [Bacteroidaceae bacterium]